MSKVKLLDLTPVKDQIRNTLLEKYDNTTYFNIEKSISIQVDIENILKEHIESKQLNEPTIFITADAYIKMRKLVEETSTELGWYGTVETHPDNQYLITDIIVYPQIVTGVTCEQDEDKMFEFEMSLTNEQVNTKRFQGHSHVNMSVTPSGVDENFYTELLAHVRDFFIIAVTNKKDDIYLRLYDKVNNLVYEDLELIIVDKEGISYDAWYISEAEKLSKKPAITPITSASKASALSEYNYFEDDDAWWNRVVERNKKSDANQIVYHPELGYISKAEMIEYNRSTYKGTKHKKKGKL